jgi:hypothetical protein
VVSLCNFETNPIPNITNGSLWTIPWEIVCYVLVGIIGVLGVLDAQKFNVLFAGILVFAFTDAHWTSESYLVLTPLILVFAGGSFLAIYETRINIRRVAVFAIAAAFLVETESPGARDDRHDTLAIRAGRWLYRRFYAASPLCRASAGALAWTLHATSTGIAH